MRVAVLMGGRSSEREISLRTGRGIAQALRNLGHETLSIDAADGRLLPAGDEEKGAPPLTAIEPAAETAIARPETLARADVVFIALHGSIGENGTLQALLDLTGRPYTGSGMLASAVAMHKAMSKRVFESAGVPTPAWQLLPADTSPQDVEVSRLGGFPLVVKPNEEGSSVGLTIVTEAGGLARALHEAAPYGEILVERYVEGRELTVSLLGDQILPIVEIRPKSGLYDYHAKYTKGASEYFCPADLPEPLAERVGRLGLEAARVLGCRGVSRVDFRLDRNDEPWCLEVNTIPGMTPTSLVPMAAKAIGMSYDQLVGRMLDLAVQDARRRAGVTART